MGLLAMWWWKDALHRFSLAGSFLPLQSEGLKFWPANHLEVHHILNFNLVVCFQCMITDQQNIWRSYMIIFSIVNFFLFSMFGQQTIWRSFMVGHTLLQNYCEFSSFQFGWFLSVFLFHPFDQQHIVICNCNAIGIHDNMLKLGEGQWCYCSSYCYCYCYCYW